MDYFNLEGKKAIVTGGSRGLGFAMAEALASYKAEVVLIGSSDKIFTASDELVKKGYKTYGIQADLGKGESSIQQCFDQSIALLGDIDILVTAAGIQRRYKAEEFPLKDWNEVLEVNLTSVFILNQLVARHMIKKNYGKIINVASMLSFFGGFTVPAYAASKGGVAQLTKAFANEWGSKGINVNAIAPGYMDTELNTALINDPKRFSKILERIPQKRWGQPEDIKGVTIFLASKGSDYLNGTIIPVDGGYLIS